VEGHGSLAAHVHNHPRTNRPPYSGNALFIKTKNHVCACPLLKHPCIHFIFAKIKQYTYKSHCFKIHFHTYTRVKKQVHKLYITCVQMLGNAKIWPYYMYNIKSWIFSYKVIKDFSSLGWSSYVYVSASYVKLAKAITVSNSISLHSNKVVT
jgi:hypothetical protein